MTNHNVLTDAEKYYLELREYVQGRMQEDKRHRPTRKYPLYSRGEASQLTIFKSGEDSLTTTDTNPAITTTEATSEIVGTTNEIVATTNPKQLPEQPEILGGAQRYLRSCAANEPNTGSERLSSLTDKESAESTVSEDSEHERHSNRSIVDLQNADTEHTSSDNSMNAQEIANV